MWKIYLQLHSDPTTTLMPANVVSEEKKGLKSSSTASVSSYDNQDDFISPQVFKGFPKAGKRKGALKSRRKSYSCIPTDTPEKNKLEAMFKNRESLKRQLPFVKKNVGKHIKFWRKLKSCENHKITVVIQSLKAV